ncbi:hypothetical protein V6N12_016056 [Hibiscus sabdariffa]|uniref:Uncharacterized protein n=1 Tax=Hibiscus sabdariffa TaxID=183260 RepID=A0ABR2AN52_9ROSI
MWAIRAWLPGSPWSIHRVGDASYSVADRHGGLLTLVSTAGPLVMFLTRVFRQGLPARSLDSLLIWALVCALDVFLVHPSAEAFPRIVLPLWLRFCALFHIFSVYCGMHALPCTRACHCVLHRPLWPCPCVVCKALASHRDLSPARDWWVMVGLCAALDPWHAVRVSLGSWMHYRVLLGPWCMVVRCEPDMLYDLWWVSYPASVPAPAASVGPVTSVAPLASGCDAMVSAPLPAHTARDNVHAACDNEAPYDPMLYRDVSDAIEDSLEVLNGCTLFADLDGMVQSAGLDDVVDEAADALIRDVASSILGRVLASSAIPATVVTTVAACSTPLPPASRPVSTCARRLSMPPVPEQDNFHAWYAAQVQAASQAPPPQPLSVGLFFPSSPSSAQ